jgi:protein involved in polysaccharide export with SLBB domain
MKPKLILAIFWLLSINLNLNLAIAAENPNTKVFDEGLPVTHSVKNNVAPYGANLFNGKFQSQRNDGLNPDYTIASGDKIKMHIWGLMEANEVVTVDAAGKMYVPEIGAVKVAGVRARDLLSVVRGKIRTVYDDGVDVYVSILTATPVSVFVTGPVNKPGQYSGLPTDSLLAYLSQAGGINHKRGSFRKIRIMRGNKVVAQADLYQFLRYGKLPQFHFKDGDTILVEQQGATVTVQGDARNPARFEFRSKTSNGQELIKYARPNESVTNVAVSGTRKNQPWSVYQPRQRFRGMRLRDGDVVRFISDAQAKDIDITIEGSHLGNSYYAVKKGSRLQELLDYVAVDPNDADIKNIYIKRKKIAEQQRKNLEQSLHRLERAVLTAPAQSDGEASIRSKEAGLVLKFIENARKVRPEGRVVVSDHGKVSNIRLEDGDVIVIPQESDIVTIDGEVQIPQAVVYAKNASVLDYVANAGGFTDRADHEHIVVVKPNGKVNTGGYLKVQPGDQILVFPKIETKNLQFAKDITQVIYQIALGAKVFF